MLIFISDLHLTDDSTNTPLKSGAFHKFVQYLSNTVEKHNAREVEIVFLGDILDLIRSEQWQKTTIRPWSNLTDTDSQQHDLKYYTIKILNDICNHSINKRSIDYINNLDSQLGIKVKKTLIIGNHDWLINQYPETRLITAKFLGMDNPNQYLNKKFDLEGYWEDYRVFARHGDINDKLNYFQDRDQSSVGDAVVIDLLSRFPKFTEDSGFPVNIANYLRNMDTVRPILDIPLWIKHACLMHDNTKIAQAVRLWDKMVQDFFKIDFVKEQLKQCLTLKLGVKTSFRIIEKFSFSKIISILLSKFSNYLAKMDDYSYMAYNEKTIIDNKADFVVYGHTHTPVIQPLGSYRNGSKYEPKMYFNTGTWQKVQVRSPFDRNLNFQSWQVMTFVSFFHEKKHHRFETWNGALG